MSQQKPDRHILTPFLLKKVPPVPSDDQRPIYPKRLNPLSWMFFWWLGPILSSGYKRKLQPADLFKLNNDIKVRTMTERFDVHFHRYLDNAKQKHIKKKLADRGETELLLSVDVDVDLEDFVVPKLILIWAMARTFAVQYSLACIYLTFSLVSQTLNPLLSKKLIQYVQLKALGLETSAGKGVGYALGTSLLVMVAGIFINHAFHNSMLTGAQVKAVLTKAMLDKSFRLSDSSKHKYPTAKITSMMGTDLARIDFALGFQPFLFTFPIPIAISIGILCHNIGAPAMVGVGLVFAYLISIMAITAKLFKFRRAANTYTDRRVNYIKEVLNNLKMIKYYAWERPYSKMISENRAKEMRIVYMMQVGRNLVTSGAMVLTLFASMAAFLTLYAVSKGTKNPAALFSSISLFNSLAQQVFMLPMALATASDAIVGVMRAGEFLAAEEIDRNATTIEATPEMKEFMDKTNLALKVDHASFKWETFENEDEDEDDEKSVNGKDVDSELSSQLEKTAAEAEIESKLEQRKNSFSSSSTELEASIFAGLTDINLSIKKGEFVVITGVIGSGKTSLLNALSGFMKRTEGSVSINGSLLLCEAPWIQNASVKENILFGLPFDSEKYKEVIYACSLESDLEILPAGDQTEIGERGITLSGGQKARINLARAVYAGKEIILLDDVLSAVDARVGKHIMNNCIMGILKDQTRILATHQLSLIGDADRVIFLNGDGSIDIGTVNELKEKNEGFNHLMAFNSEAKKEEEEEEEDQEYIETEKELIERQITRQLTQYSKKGVSVDDEDEEARRYDYGVNEDKDGQLMTKEHSAENSIQFAVYKRYLQYGSGIFKYYSSVPIVIMLTILAVFSYLFTNTWLSFWSDRKFPGKDNGFYIGFYVMFTILSLVFLSFEFVILAYMTNKAATKLNLKAVESVLRVPMAYMDITPMGRMLNRFTKDTDTLDNEIGNQIRMVIFFFSNIVGIIILCIIYLPWFAIAVPFLAFVFVAIANFYQTSGREIKRLEATQRSFVYNNFNETLSGMDTIKAYKAQGRFMETNDENIDNMNEAYYITIANQRWLSIHLDVVATAFALLICFLCVFRVFKIGAASVGLLLSNVLLIAGQLSLLVRTFTQLENEMNSVERICEYAFELPEEAPYQISETAPPQSWPENGSIRFENVSLSYRPGLPLVLKGLNMDIGATEKIGICGRTGAGKSSIMTALYRLSELDNGKVEIDGIDISKIGLYDLRSKLSIIPQDPVLFRGTIRKNLDPFGESSDEMLWDSLRRAGLIEDSKLSLAKAQDKSSENMHKFHLDREVEDEGSNFSLGERQLIAFARALVRGSKILILDEATSSVDYETDSKIQATIAREFNDCTILCIAHRLRTILNYDRILVLDKGEIKQLDTPLNLYNSRNGIFRQMCERSNITADDFGK